MRALLLLVLQLALAGLIGATLAGFLGALAWPFELFAHFRPQLAAGAAAALALALPLGRAPAAALAALLLAANVAPLWSHLGAHIGLGAQASLTTSGPAATRRPLRILTYNMLGMYSDADRFRSILATERPDVLVLTELPNDLERYMRGLEDAYPHRYVPARRTAHEVAIYSRWPLAALAVDHSVDDLLPVVGADICPAEDASCFRLVAVHGLVPFFRGAALRDAQLTRAGAIARAAPTGRAVLAGDFNLTPWAPGFERLLADSGLIDTSPLRGLTPTWVTRNRILGPVGPLLALSIDHVLVSPQIEARAVRVLSPLGSDHRPVIADLALPPS